MNLLCLNSVSISGYALNAQKSSKFANDPLCIQMRIKKIHMGEFRGISFGNAGHSGGHFDIKIGL